MSDIEKIAAGLTAAQKQALVHAEYYALDDGYWLPENVSRHVLRSLVAKNLVHLKRRGRLRMDGLAVRNHLRAQENGNG